MRRLHRAGELSWRVRQQPSASSENMYICRVALKYAFFKKLFSGAIAVDTEQRFFVSHMNTDNVNELNGALESNLALFCSMT
jgi:hypothetical protein